MEAAPSNGGSSLRILVADDDALFADSITAVLGSEGRVTVVGHAADGEQAIELAQSLRPNLVLMDLAMPRCDGVEATRRIKAIAPEVAILVLTSSRADEDVRRAGAAGADGYLTKESVTSDFAATILEIAAVAVRPRAPGDTAAAPRESS